MNIIKKRINDYIIIMSLISYSQYSDFILIIVIKKSIANKVTSFTIFNFNLNEFLLTIRTFVFTSMIIKLLIIFNICFIMYA